MTTQLVPPPIDERQFACNHGDDAVAECAARMTWALDHLKATPSDFLTQLVYQLWWRYSVTVEAIHVDQWAMVVTRRLGAEAPDCFTCDAIEDGLAMALQFYVEKGEAPVE